MGLEANCKARVEDIVTQLCPGASHLVSKVWGADRRAACIYGARVAMLEEGGGEAQYKVVILWAYESPREEFVGISGGRFHKRVKIDRLLHNNNRREGYFVFDDSEPFECFVFELAGQQIGYIYRVQDMQVITPDQAAGALAGNAVLGNDGSEEGAEHDFSTKTATEVHSMDAGRYSKWYRTYVHKASTSFKQAIEEKHEITGTYDFWEYTREAKGSPDLPEDYRARYPLVIFVAFIKEEEGTRVIWKLTHSGKPFSCLRYDTSRRRTFLFESTDAQGDVLDHQKTEFRNYIFSYDEGTYTFSADTPIIMGIDRELVRQGEESSQHIAELAKQYANLDKESLLIEEWRKEFSKHFDGDEVEEKIKDALYKYRTDKLRPK